MTIPVTEAEQTSIAVPLMSGNAFTVDGQVHQVAQVVVVVTAADGTEMQIALTARHGGWWAPPLA